MKIRLTRTDILKALPKVTEGLGKYLCIQALVEQASDLTQDAIFQKRYNGFYKVRRNEEWRRHYYKILESQRHKKKGKGLEFLDVLKTIHRETGKVEASFASKLTATIDTSLPVIDSIVMKNLGLKLPGSGTPQRLSEMAKVYDEMTAYYKNYLGTEDGKYLVEQFEKQYPRAKISNVKMLDFVLWQTRQ
jgi:hypothetical protein